MVGRKQLRQETAALKSQLSSNTESLDGILASEGDRHRRYRAAVVRQRSQEARRELVASREGQTEHTAAVAKLQEVSHARPTGGHIDEGTPVVPICD